MPVRLGIIGYGGMAGWHHKNCVRVDGVSVLAAYDIDPERVLAARENGLRGYDTLAAFLADDEVNTVLVATPNDCHEELVIAALNAGKHVLCEKPVTLSLAAFDRMADAAKKNGKLFTAHQNRRWDKDYLIARKLYQSGELGKVYSIQSRLHGAGGAMHGWRGEKKHGGGMLLDWGVHFIDQAYNMLGWGAFLSVNCFASNVKTSEVEDYFSLTLEAAGGLQYIIEIGTFVLKELPRWMLLGDEKTAYINDFSRSGGVISLNSIIEQEEVILQTEAGPTRTFAPRPKEVKNETDLPDAEGQWTDFYANLRDAVEGKAELIVQPWQIRRVLAAMMAGFESIETRKRVSLI